MLILPGTSALSGAKRSSLLREVRKTLPDIESIDSVWIHFVKCVSEGAEAELSLSDSEKRRSLDALLNYGDDISLNGSLEALKAGASQVVWVVPRLGSISPWSSKATDIAGICNLSSHIERIERGIAFIFTGSFTLSLDGIKPFSHLLHDRMTQSLHIRDLPPENALFKHAQPKPLLTINLTSSVAKTAEDILKEANTALGLALSPDEITYLVSTYTKNPTDAELFMFAQVNSEHCRHKIFNAKWSIDGVDKDLSLFQMIRNTEKASTGKNTISAYSDNAAVFQGSSVVRFSASPEYTFSSDPEAHHTLIKVETHNHPTAVSPYPGAATGTGGEIRDEAAVGRGSRTKAGLAGYTTSDVCIPGFKQPWEQDPGRPGHIASSLDVMIEAPLGASAFGNEFGRPGLGGYWRTFCQRVSGKMSPEKEEYRGYHKPIMIAGGLGTVRPQFTHKTKISPGAKLVVLGGPGMLIGLGGGAASSSAGGGEKGKEELDFASVQRGNAEMERRCQGVIDSCISTTEDDNPIESIHDVGAGGLSNALPELVHDSDLGAHISLRDIPIADSGLSPMEIWCNESQERYVLAVSSDPEKLRKFEEICQRERCPYAVVGEATAEQELVVTDSLLGGDVIRLDMGMLFGKPPKMHRVDTTVNIDPTSLPTPLISGLASPTSRTLQDAIERLLRLPSIGSKSFLITIGDRTITGLVTRDQMVGPWQVPVADVAVTRTTYPSLINPIYSGEAMTMGERPPLALLNPAASARIAVAESLTNLAAAYLGVDNLDKVKLSANWMASPSKPNEGAALYAAVQAVGMDLCPKLGVGIPVGKDSMSMSMKWKDGEKAKEVTSPVSLIVTAFAGIEDVRETWTPQLHREGGEIVLVDLAAGKQRMGGSALAQVYGGLTILGGGDAPDLTGGDVDTFKAFFRATQEIRKEGVVLAYHDRSDGGLFTTAVEMAFAGRVGVDLTVPEQNVMQWLFNEELGAVFQVRDGGLEVFQKVFVRAGVPATSIHIIGTLRLDEQIRLIRGTDVLYQSTRGNLQKMWAETSYKIQEIRDDPHGAKEEFDLISDKDHTGLFFDLTFQPSLAISPTSHRPKVAILREQGVNGHVEMAYAFHAAGFQPVDVHMTDLLASPSSSPRVSLRSFTGLAACGGFSYGDVLGAGKGWAHSVLLNDRARSEFQAFFARKDTFTLAVCNGCQFLSHLREIIPGAENWPDFKENKSGRFEGRVCMVEVVDSSVARKSVFLRGMVGSRLPVAVAHGEGRVSFPPKSALDPELIGVRYVDSKGQPTERYPLNPNGSPGGITGVQTPDGRVLAMMPHPERVVTLEANSWVSDEIRNVWRGGKGPWMRLFESAREWCSS